MGKRQKEWARRQREKLRAMLGGVCKKCGSDAGLEFDCIDPAGDAHHKLSTDHRVGFYRVQIAIDNLQLLCRTCHEAKTAAEAKQQPEEPF